MATYISHSPAETEALGEKFGRAARPGLVIALSGDLGAGNGQGRLQQHRPHLARLDEVMQVARQSVA